MEWNQPQEQIRKMCRPRYVYFVRYKKYLTSPSLTVYLSLLFILKNNATNSTLRTSFNYFMIFNYYTLIIKISYD